MTPLTDATDANAEGRHVSHLLQPCQVGTGVNGLAQGCLLEPEPGWEFTATPSLLLTLSWVGTLTPVGDSHQRSDDPSQG